MNIDGIGIDIVQIKRIKLNFVNKFLVGQEVDIFNNILDEKEKIRFLAGRFAAKEAIIKATDKSYLFSKMEILSKESGRPYLIYDGKEDNKISISISHEKKYSVGLAVFENK